MLSAPHKAFAYVHLILSYAIIIMNNHDVKILYWPILYLCEHGPAQYITSCLSAKSTQKLTSVI